VFSIPFINKEPSKEDLFVEMLEAYKDQFYRIAYSYMKNEHDALDAIQESVCRAYASLEKLKEIEHMKTWFVRIVINTAINELKLKKRFQPSVEVENVLEDGQKTPPYEEQVEDKLDLMDTLSLLSEKEQAIIILRFFEDYKLEDVAKSVDLPLNTTKTTLYRALKKMRINYEEAMDDDE
tara:strand:+ start:214 stop:753 length:540 start_codon:yes stop_codon:yes gene_type:complete